MESGLVRPKEEVESAVRNALTGVPVADGILDMQAKAGVDTGGDPAVHITMNLRAGNFTDAELMEIKATVYEIRRRILDLDLGSFPYFKLEQAA